MKNDVYHLTDWLKLLRRPDGPIRAGAQPQHLERHGVVIYSGDESAEYRRIREQTLERMRKEQPAWYAKHVGGAE